jgi:hypothetical protein
MIVFLTLLSFAPAYSAAAEKNSTLSKKDLKVLLKSAKTPSEHQRIADYYRQKAQELTASSKQHSEFAETYAKNPPFPAMEAKHGSAFGQGVSHCRRWAKLDAEQADKATRLAILHEDMATKAELKSADEPGTKRVAAATTFASLGK